ncbi:hypothetical protein [uncultured Helicobacter sp.]|uniref:hypothetical protein n=1 Tax=uncultured Helicobacter sp. TaxID=175537 RepID=UPI0025EA9548|nr:hypothetical protein [uncultured Helicobacter sp.]
MRKIKLCVLFLLCSIGISFANEVDDRTSKAIKAFGLAYAKGYAYGTCVFQENFNTLSKTSTSKSESVLKKIEESSGKTCMKQLKVEEWIENIKADKILTTIFKIGAKHGNEQAVDSQQDFFENAPDYLKEEGIE